MFILIFGVMASAVSIEKIELEGNQKVSSDTIRFYMKSREKGLYLKSILKEDFRSLWKTGFFENITIESRDGTTGKIV
jgi:outer membrane protein insertion porin family